MTANDRERSATASGLSSLQAALRPLSGARCTAILDIGCGYGGLTSAVGSQLGALRLHGVDIDPDVLSEASAKGINAKHVDVEAQPLPYEDHSFDFVLSLGMLDYLPVFDDLLVEIRRVLVPGGHVLLSIPNLGSWHNRIALLFGFQPRDVEISDRAIVGALPHYRKDPPAGHLHTATLRAFRDLMHLHGYDEVNITGGAWATRPIAWPIALVDRVLALRPALARRYFYLGTKAARDVEHERAGWWSGRDTLRGG